MHGQDSQVGGTGTKGFLARLRDDRAGNVMAIAAAAVIPLIGMVGGAVDVSRYYMTVTRLQNACDAGALAARRAMADDNFAEEHRQLGLTFFDENYKTGQFGLENGTRDYTDDGDGTVTGTASGQLPTTLMTIFGFDEFDISVSCSAEINISNTDIVFVLDVTGSMNCPDDGSSCPSGNNGNTEVGNSRIVGLRDAVMTFYDTVDAATSSAAQVRYGVVPYASNVNVGFSIPTQFMATSHTYQSRFADYDLEGDWEFVSATIQSISTTSVGSQTDTQDDRVKVSNQAECDALRPADYVAFDDQLGRFNQQSQSVNGNIRTTVYNDTNEDILIYRGFADYEHHNNANRRRCTYGHRVYEGRGDAIWEEVEEWVEEIVFKQYIYRPIDTASPPTNPAGSPAGWESVNLATLYDDNQIDLPTGSQGAMQTHTWDGCIEEARTTANTTTDFDPTPSDAFDLNINLEPSTEAERWKPALPWAVWKRESGGNTQSWLYQTWNENRPNYDCPARAFRLTELENSNTLSGGGVMATRRDLDAYLDALQARSNTYHDIGMIWGARFISPRGIFKADNATAPNGDAIARHIVFMTDGILATDNERYTPYGTEWWDRRISSDGANGTSSNNHSERFQAACRAARQENISVWVVAFGTTLTQNLVDCATPGRAYTATDGASLNQAFQEIAQKIAALRLTS